VRIVVGALRGRRAGATIAAGSASTTFSAGSAARAVSTGSAPTTRSAGGAAGADAASLSGCAAVARTAATWATGPAGFSRAHLVRLGCLSALAIPGVEFFSGHGPLTVAGVKFFPGKAAGRFLVTLVELLAGQRLLLAEPVKLIVDLLEPALVSRGHPPLVWEGVDLLRMAVHDLLLLLVQLLNPLCDLFRRQRWVLSTWCGRHPASIGASTPARCRLMEAALSNARLIDGLSGLPQCPQSSKPHRPGQARILPWPRTSGGPVSSTDLIRASNAPPRRRRAGDRCPVDTKLARPRHVGTDFESVRPNRITPLAPGLLAAL
jgi:hypothetical protein